jgi:oxygen-independent coproporphyrinogen-3 oxidase
LTPPPPVAVYVHWPYCRRICPYCDFVVVRDRGREDEQAGLAEAIAADLAEQARRIGPRRLVSVFFGGGTPSLMAPAHVERIVRTAADAFAPEADLEISLEANPTDAEVARYAGFAAAGVNRLSLGLQALDDASLRFLGRDHSAAEGVRAAETARRTFSRLSLDLIYARPGQAPDAWAAELEAAVALGPEHLSPYQLTVEPGTAFDRAVRRGRFAPAGPDLGADLYETTRAVLAAGGFDAYEVSNHARGEAARARHNLAIWRGAEYLGVGPGAHGRAALDGARTATRAAVRIADYRERVAATGVGWASNDPLASEEAAEERLMLGLRIVEGVPWRELGPLASAVRDRAGPLAEAGLLDVGPDRLGATAAGRPVLDALLRALLA